MKKNLPQSKMLSAGVLVLLLFGLICFAPGKTPMSIARSDIAVTLDGQTVIFPAGYGQPYIDTHDRTLVPLRGVMEFFAATVAWDDAARTAIVSKAGITVKVPVGEKYILVNGAPVMNDTVAVIKEERMYLPLRAVLEAFGACLGWDDVNRTVVISSPDSEKEKIPQPDPGNLAADTQELKALWISFLEYMDLPKDRAGFEAGIAAMFDRSAALGMNAVIVHVRSHCDAMYPSQYYPWSLFASGEQGVDPGYDPLAYMVEAAHNRGLTFHAWINPYRVTGYGTTWAQVAVGNPVKVWLADKEASNDRWVLLHNGEYYLNPSIPQVRQLVVDGVREIVTQYPVDGIHFDDYFYPTVKDQDPALCFDQPEYAASKSTLRIADWRRENVNMLVREVYAAVKAVKADLVFGISPAGNVERLRSDTVYFADVDTWLSKDGYVDYIMPQLYWGFERRDAAGKIASYAYENNLRTWMKLAAKGNSKLYVGLNVANAGTNVTDYNSVSEWLRYDDVLARQVTAARNTGKVAGFAFFRYAVFDSPAAQAEVENLTKKLGAGD